MPMPQAQTPIYCQNALCQASNKRGRLSCERCGNHIPHRYLWVLDPKALKGKNPGDLLADRYYYLHSQILLDTKPSHIPLFPSEIDETAVRYAEMFRYRNNVPQIYGFFESSDATFALLENSAIYPQGIKNSQGQDLGGQLMPRMVDRWENASTKQKLSWLTQLAQLWQPLGMIGKTDSILHPDVIRVDGDRIKILYLRKDRIVNPSLANFAEIFLTEIPHLATEKPWNGIFDRMIHQEIINSDQLLDVLDQESAMLQIASGASNGKVSIATLTDRGPNRPKNEDACYPPAESRLTNLLTESTLLVICDGIGGHEGGSFASNAAISTINTHLQNFNPKGLTAEQITAMLEAAVKMANDMICDRNDAENRQERQRMGTTIVLAFLYGNQLYITHVGDSRAYRISMTGCYQVTVDDDLASRETILGSSFYREALQYPGTGSLTQALGMAPSINLQPTTQQFFLSEDCIFLLCSDGLSDFDRVDESWQTELLPVLAGKRDLYEACQSLIEVANTRNGHDNVTVGLLHFQGGEPGKPPVVNAIVNNGSAAVVTSPPRPVKVPTTRPVVVPERSSNGLTKIFFSLIGLGLIWGGIFWALLQQRSVQAPLTPSPPPTVAISNLWDVGKVLKLDAPATAPLELLSEPGQVPGLAPPAVVTTLQPGTIVQVMGLVAQNPQEPWVKLKVCSVPNATPQPTATPTAPIEGWQLTTKLAAIATPLATVPIEQLGSCQSIQAEPSPSPTVSPEVSPTLSPTPLNQAQ
jgi:protein phosphatase